MEAAYAAFNLARVLTLQSQKAEDAAALLQQAESLVLEAHGIALAAGDATQAATFVDEILELLTADSAACATASQLRAAYLEASGEEWSPKPLDVLIVGAGASGVGMGILLTKVFRLRPQRVLLVERGGGVGESFLRWPREMRFISPSFNQQGWTKSFDLNSVVYGTSPAFTLHAEHPTGEQYARYLRALAERAKLAVRTGTEVEAVEVGPAGDDGGGERTVLRSRYVVWAAGELQSPRERRTHVQDNGPLFPGCELCLHNSEVRSWKELPGDDFVVIGGYESGMDAASNLAASGRRFRRLSRGVHDPSTELAPYTAERVRAACASPTPPRLLAPLRVFAVERAGRGDAGGYVVRAREVSLCTPQPPVLCAGFEGSEKDGAAAGCAEGAPLLTEQDESTKTPGLFLVGPAVRHGELSFCFVYKFRQRFGIVADAIARGLGRDTKEAVEECREMNMFLDDFECCKAACGESC
ncbi:hypothetical protein EMIHUDRAFT_69760 [Emiliania huxleyi CCMP1516]|uniref:FAD/NAD(P)-binding domain-containing protein n=2 Tax=Emiliania huxleyi TaxID=2903 RepID=A0A0D3KX83_EMIH1|nr:hypothetical protein EMIHUDRAFT_69760 [Emiliania huxleyi CCMP1516]EOD40368.1 hypothetical protein EMIHUDRAFT_69760 [Emiliania huxleyi CCMP1516]|eukprot:XP_005792797.1 hypothetical protein EMIHUDRAFT_69760 [Emiliania huxleyi CCMP1516]